MCNNPLRAVPPSTETITDHVGSEWCRRCFLNGKKRAPGSCLCPVGLAESNPAGCCSACKVSTNYRNCEVAR